MCENGSKSRYIIVQECSLRNLALAVNAKYKDGYLPQGGVGHSPGLMDARYYQSMVLTDK